MGKLFRSELLKLRKSVIWLLVFVSPLLSLLVGLLESSADTLNPWAGTFLTMAMMHALLFLPLLTGVFAAFVCRYEHVGGGWKQLLAMPVTRSKVYLVKLSLVMLLLIVTQLLLLGSFVLVGQMKGYAGPLPWDMVGSAIVGGWLACLPLAALQMGVSTAWSSFAAPLAVNVIFTLPNILVVNSADYGPYYPWAQPFLMMMPYSGDSFGALNVSAETLLFVILGSFVVFLASGLVYFNRKAV